MSEAYGDQLAREIDRALTIAERQVMKESSALFPFIVGYLIGDCSDDQQAQIKARIGLLLTNGPRPNQE